MTNKPDTVLLVEDSPLFRKMMADYLATLGFTQVLEAPSGRAAMELLSKERPHLVCMDLVLPDVSGYDLCEFIRGQDGLAEVPILMISARTLTVDKAQAEEVGANGYLTKPFTQEEFTAQVQKVLAQGSRS